MRPDSENGNVVVEFIGVVVALLIPLTVITGAAIEVSRSYIATDVAARAGSRSFVVSNSDSAGRSHAISAVRVAMEDHGVWNSSVSTKYVCSESPCLSPGGYVKVTVSQPVQLSLPASLGSRTIVLQSSHTSVVDEIR